MMMHATHNDARYGHEDVVFLDDALVELVEEPPTRASGLSWDLDDIETRVWIRPYAGR